MRRRDFLKALAGGAVAAAFGVQARQIAQDKIGFYVVGGGYGIPGAAVLPPRPCPRCRGVVIGPTPGGPLVGCRECDYTGLDGVGWRPEPEWDWKDEGPAGVVKLDTPPQPGPTVVVTIPRECFWKGTV